MNVLNGISKVVLAGQGCLQSLKRNIVSSNLGTQGLHLVAGILDSIPKPSQATVDRLQLLNYSLQGRQHSPPVSLTTVARLYMTGELSLDDRQTISDAVLSDDKLSVNALCEKHSAALARQATAFRRAFSAPQA